MKTDLACLRNWGRKAVNKIKALGYFWGVKGVLQLLFGLDSFSLTLRPPFIFGLLCSSRALGGWFLWSTAPWLPCPLVSYFVWSVENREISFFLSLRWFSVPLWLLCMTTISSSPLPLQTLYDDGFRVLGSLSIFCCSFSYQCLWKSYQ